MITKICIISGEICPRGNQATKGSDDVALDETENSAVEKVFVDFALETN